MDLRRMSTLQKMLLQGLLDLKMETRADPKWHLVRFLRAVIVLRRENIIIPEEALVFMLLESLPMHLYRPLKAEIMEQEGLPSLAEFEQRILMADIPVPTELPPLQVYGNNLFAQLTDTPYDQMVWCLDAASVTHICVDPYRLESNIRRMRRRFAMGNGELVESVAAGDVNVVVPVRNGTRVIHFEEVHCVPEMEKNTLSVGQLSKMGLTVTFRREEALVFDSLGRVIARAIQSNSMYYLRDKNVPNFNEPRLENSFARWHRRLGHVAPDVLMKIREKMHKYGVEIDSPREKLVCYICEHGKTTLAPEKRRQSTRVLEIVYSAVGGPVAKPSLDQKKYFVSFTDDYTRWTEVYLMREKSEVLMYFQIFKYKLENFTGECIKYFHSSYSGEYMNRDFNSFLVLNNIERELEPRFVSFGDWINHRLLDTVKCLMVQSYLQLGFWGEALATAVYIQNRCPRKSLKGVSPFQKLFDKVPYLGHFKHFGCAAYFLNSEQFVLGGPPIDRCQKLVFSGYSEDGMGYLLFHTHAGYLINAPQVVFHEDDFSHGAYSVNRQNHAAPGAEDPEEIRRIFNEVRFP